MVLVTGGTGLLGAHLILHLHQLGIVPRAIYRQSIPPGLQQLAHWVQADLLDVVALEAAMEGVSQVYHCAGMVSFVSSQKNQLYKVNVEGTANVVNAALAARVQKLVHVSSVAALGRKRQGQPIAEDLQWTPETSNSTYARTKYLGEMEVWRGIGEGLNAVIVNPSIIFGEQGNWEVGSMRMFKTVHSGFPWYSTGTTGFVDANDVVLAMTQLMQSEHTAQRFVVSAENAMYRDVFFMIADAFGTKRPHKKVSALAAALVWRLAAVASFFTQKAPFITKETARTSLAESRFSHSKLLAALPQFQFTPLASTIKRICQHYQHQHNLAV
ncbi:MAG: NAD-dependent epimerase/dehydratase family protein [Bacteroidetes bacterium]|nr:MAG: NAD-dependent epimerase/dehydratase family protein [Bacteroidota bacterium]